MHTSLLKALRQRPLLACLTALFLTTQAGAELLRFNDEMALNVIRADSWTVEMGRPPSPPFPFQTINLRPKDDRNATILITVLAKNDPETLTPDFLRKVLIGDSAPWIAHSPDKKMPEIQRLTSSHIKGLYATFIDANLVGKPPKKKDYKITTAYMLAIDQTYMVKVSFLYDEKASSEYREGMLMIQSLSAK